MLNTKNLPMTYVNKDSSWRKLEHQWAVHFKISKLHWPNDVELELPADIIIHGTVNFNQLHTYTTYLSQENPPPQPIRTAWDKDGTIQYWYLAEDITSQMEILGVKDSFQYQIKSKGYNDITWQPAINLSKAKQILHDYKKQPEMEATKAKQTRKG